MSIVYQFLVGIRFALNLAVTIIVTSHAKRPPACPGPAAWPRLHFAASETVALNKLNLNFDIQNNREIPVLDFRTHTMIYMLSVA